MDFRCTIVALLCSFLLAAGCAPAGSSGGQDSYVDFDDGSELEEGFACLYSADDGWTAVDRKASSSEVVSTFFDKRFNKAHLDAVMKASARDTVRYIESFTNAKVYHIKTRSQKCRIFEFLPRVDDELRVTWRRLTGGGIEGGLITGLYLQKGFRLGDDPVLAAQGGGVILLRDRGTRWTLVHEFMHHLFHKQAAEDGSTDDELLKGLLYRSSRRLALFQEALSRDPAHEDSIYNASLEFRQLFGYLKEVLVRYALEEMTIERTLSARYRLGKLAWVPNRTDNALAYIEASAKGALKMLSDFKEFGGKVIKAARPGTDFAAQQIASMRETMLQVDGFAQEIISFAREAGGGQRFSPQLRSASAPAAVTQPAPAAMEVCSHYPKAQEMEEAALGALRAMLR